LLLAAYCLLLNAYCLLLPVHCSPFTARLDNGAICSSNARGFSPMMAAAKNLGTYPAFSLRNVSSSVSRLAKSVQKFLS
jgi:hypothetical protein